MEITEVRVKLADEYDDERMLAYCSVTLDNAFVVRDLRVVTGSRGQTILCMPSRKITDRCLACSARNSLLARFCNECGGKLVEGRGTIDPRLGRIKFFQDIVHPADSRFRCKLEDVVLEAVAREQARSEEETR